MFIVRIKLKKIMLIIIAFTIIIGSGIFIRRTLFRSKYERLNNISKLSDEFMDNYFEEVGEASDDEKENMLIVTSERKIKDSYGATKIIEAPNNQYILQYSSEEEKKSALEKFKDDNKIESVEENIVYTSLDTEYNSWGIQKMSLDYAMDYANVYSENMQPVTVAIIDTGCDMTLFNKYYAGRIEGFYNILAESDTTMLDENGHGTHIAGTIAEGTPSNVKIFPVKTSSDGRHYNTDIVAAINYVVRNKKADVINMSLGSYYKSEAIEQAIYSANKENIICVAAAGNENTDKKSYPAAFDTTISIASVDSNLQRSSFSNYGSEITFAAPGTDVKSIMGKDAQISIIKGNPDGDDDHETISGTSMATPHAVSAVALLKGYNKNLTLTNVIDLLKETAIDLGERGWDEYYGNGLISFNNAQFCNGNKCDKYGIYTDVANSISSLEITNVSFTGYNYYSETNLMGSKVNVSYTDGTSEELILGKLPEVEILNYDPTISGSQSVTVKVRDVTTDIQVTNPDNYESGWIYNNLEDGKIEITGYKNHGLKIENLIIPETIDSKIVVSFADNFKFSESGDDIEYYKYLYLPSSFTRIGNYSFADTNIKNVYGKDIKIEVGAHAFENSQIETIDVPITKIEEYAFKDCFELIYIDTWAKDYGEIDIGQYAFYNCKKLSSFKTVNEEGHNRIGDVGDYAFYNCVSLAYVNIYPVGSIGEYAFYNTFLLFNFDISSSESIGRFAFYESGIKEANFSYRLDVINESAFENCKNLKDASFVGGRIESKAFWNSSVETISISDKLEYIAEDAFAYTPMKSDSGSNGDTGIYKTIHGLGIVELSTNKLIIGFTDHLNITSDITEIGNYAFTGNDTLKTITIPETVTKIGSHAFEDCYQLSDVIMLGDSIDFSNDTFKRNYDGEIKNTDLNIYIHKNSNLKQFIKSKNLNYRHIEADDIVVTNYENTYKALSQVDYENLSVKLLYHEEEDRYEDLSINKESGGILLPYAVGFGISYQSDKGYRVFQYGDTYFTVEARNNVGYSLSKNVDVNVEKIIPEYTVPADLSAQFGQKLSEIELPEGFEWVNGNQTIDKYGEVIYKAKFIPTDTTNYATIENIDITITVSSNKSIINPEISIQNKSYDGTTNISVSKISISNLDDSEYSIVSAVSSSADAGNRTATIKLKLSDDKFNTYSFDDGSQEKEFTVPFEILKANINVTDNSNDVTVNYDGNEHNIDMHLNYEPGAITKYMDENNEYTLDNVPKYTEIGTYVTKYKVYINDNYTEYFGQKTLTITATSNELNINNYEIEGNIIKGISLNTNVSDLDLGLSDSYTVKVKNKANEEKEGLIGTGDRIEIYLSNNLVSNYYASVKGDINGDGLLKLKDLLTVKNYILKFGDIRSEFDNTNFLFEAADYSSDGKISLKDFAQMKIDFLSH